MPVFHRAPHLCALCDSVASHCFCYVSSSIDPGHRDEFYIKPYRMPKPPLILAIAQTGDRCLEITSSTAIALLLLGTLVGVVGGMIGIGGGILVIPLLMFFFGFTQQKANGTSLAMLLPPIGLLAVIRYYQAGNIDIKVALLLACGFAGGAYLGAWIVNR